MTKQSTSAASIIEGRPSLLDLAQPLIASAKPGEEVEIVLSRSGGVNIKAYRGEVESLTSAESFGVGVRVIVDGRVGFAHAGSHDPEVLAEVLADARDNVQFSERDVDQTLARPDGHPAIPQPQLWSEAVLEARAADKIALAIELERRTTSSDPRVRSVRSATFSDSWGESALLSTAGIAVESRGTGCSIAVQAMATDGAETQAGFGYAVGRDPRLLDVEQAAADAVTRSTRLLGAVKPLSGKVAIVCEPRLTATLMGIVSGMCSGEALIKGRTPFAGRIGEMVASPLVTLYDDPTDARSQGADEYDGEGLACRRTTLIGAGTLESFLHNTYTARRVGGVSTASAVRGSRSLPGVGPIALALAGGEGSLEDLIADVELGIFVNSFAGLHSGVNPISGDFSVGADGLMIRDGALAEPVREITLASTLQRMLADVSRVGSDIEWLPSGAAMPSIVIPDVTMSGR